MEVSRWPRITICCSFSCFATCMTPTKETPLNWRPELEGRWMPPGGAQHSQLFLFCALSPHTGNSDFTAEKSWGEM